MGNDQLRQAINTAQLDPETVASAAGVDPKTVQRWLAGSSERIDLLGYTLYFLWEQHPGSLACSSKRPPQVARCG